jgi:hypothetical protein
MLLHVKSHYLHYPVADLNKCVPAELRAGCGRLESDRGAGQAMRGNGIAQRSLESRPQHIDAGRGGPATDMVGLLPNLPGL